ncbi:envelope stress sensor histidine kinase CpxA [Vibrio gallicus]|uniref:envelope stress sensor histidine kinase CpxA n=1 Tax=Vibrio gallicus TaxID=190897 RepID=UPI0021C3E49D|nr:envelope stress sensor histidine kinase CpxA [Vibrio gallicus]
MNLPKISSLYGRIFAIFWITVLMVLIAVIGIQKLDPRKSHSVKKDSVVKITQLIKKVEKDLNQNDDIPKRLKHLNKKRFGNKDFRLYLADNDGNLLSPERGFKRRALQAMASELTGATQPSQRQFEHFMVAGPFPILVHQTHFSMYAGFNHKPPPPLLYRILDAPFTLLLVVMLVSTPLLLWCAWTLSQPARRLEQAAKRVAHGEFEVDPLLEKGTSEFKQAGTSFNQMVLSVNHMVSGQQKMLSDISHELRSPLTRLRMANALATRKQGDSKELQRIETEADRLEQMIRDLLDLSRMQIDSQHNRSLFSLPELWKEILLDAQFEAEQSGMTLELTAIPEHQILGNFKLLTSAVENIVRNAIRYGDKHIRVRFSVIGQLLQLDVEDDGPGVADEELESIFRPFYRVSNARDRDSGGTGLGLAITENAVLQHNGTIKASPSQDLGGLHMHLTLPLKG